MSDEMNQADRDEAWLDQVCMERGIKATVDQVDDFLERVAIKWANGLPDKQARLEALREIFNV